MKITKRQARWLSHPDRRAEWIRHLEFELEKADYGMGMPRDYRRVLELRVALEQAKKDAHCEREG